MIDISKLSKRYSVRVLEESDVETLARICKQNTVFYEYTEARPTKENILNDMKATPPGITMDDKYYFGFFDDRELIAIMDLIDAYGHLPRPMRPCFTASPGRVMRPKAAKPSGGVYSARLLSSQLFRLLIV